MPRTNPELEELRCASYCTCSYGIPAPNVQVDDLDYAIRKKSPEKATAAYAEAKSALKEALAALG